MLKLVSLFSGCGGLDFGFHYDPAFEVVFVTDRDRWATDSYIRNFGDSCPVVTSKIEDVATSDIPACDVVIGGPPCQGFSTSGWYDKGDPRNQLYREYIRVLYARRPKLFLFENVPGLEAMEREKRTDLCGKVLELMLWDFSRAGYEMTWKKYDLANYGVPQRRKRIIIAGVRKDLAVSWVGPRPTHANQRILSSSLDNFIRGRTRLKPWVTVRQAFRQIGSDASERARGAINNIQSRYKLLWDEPARYTILASSTKVPIHPDYNGSMDLGVFPVRLSINECKVLQTIPLAFELAGPITSQFKMIGNAVPPLFSERLAGAVKRTLLG